MPVPNTLTSERAAVIYSLILKKEKLARDIAYRGFSLSRITGERLGSHEYELDGWRWPADFAPHYVRDHRVCPSKEFLRFIISPER